MGAGFRDCVVAFIDLDGIKQLAPGGGGSRQMRELHDVVVDATDDHGFDCIARTYVWNDSVLLLSYVDNDQHGYRCAVRDFYRLKKCIDHVADNFCVVVKGQSFPYPERPSTLQDGRFVFIEASSYAMANCMDMPKRFENNRHQWYLDERVSHRLCGLLAQPASRLKIRLLPTNEERYVYAYDDLWLGDERGLSRDAGLVPR